MCENISARQEEIDELESMFHEMTEIHKRLVSRKDKLNDPAGHTCFFCSFHWELLYTYIKDYLIENQAEVDWDKFKEFLRPFANGECSIYTMNNDE